MEEEKELERIEGIAVKLNSGVGGGSQAVGELVLSTRRLRFEALGARGALWVSLPALARLVVVRAGKGGAGLRVEGKEGRVFALVRSSPADDDVSWWEEVAGRISAAAAAAHRGVPLRFRPHSGVLDGWSLFDPLAEYARLGLLADRHGSPGSRFRLSTANREFGLCKTYPREFVVPADLTDEDLERVSLFRSKGRLPAVVWVHPQTGAAMARCSQPLVGLRGNRSKADEAFVAALRGNAETVWILDSRPKLNAIANSVKGAGFERTSHYPACELFFNNIPNIHGVRGAFQDLLGWVDKHYGEKREKRKGGAGKSAAAAESPSAGGADGAAEDDLAPSLASSAAAPHEKKLEWLQLVAQLLETAAMAVTALSQLGYPLLVHCSDGWDRTSQVCALAELMLDPFYRTMEGFCVLIEKEWLAFGHKFEERLGHGAAVGDSSDHNRSPVFLQFLDATAQLVRQFPAAFQFSTRLLMFVAEHAYACEFGTFLRNCVREREEAELAERTASVWTAVLANLQDFVENSYDPARYPASEPLVPLCSAADMVVLPEFYIRWSSIASVADLPVPYRSYEESVPSNLSNSTHSSSEYHHHPDDHHHNHHHNHHHHHHHHESHHHESHHPSHKHSPEDLEKGEEQRGDQGGMAISAGIPSHSSVSKKTSAATKNKKAGKQHLALGESAGSDDEQGKKKRKKETRKGVPSSKDPHPAAAVSPRGRSKTSLARKSSAEGL